MLTRLIESVIIAGVNGLACRKRRGGSAEVETKTAEGSVLIGHTIPGPRSVESSVPVTLSADTRRRHIYVLGATGCGKTNMLMRLVESDIRDNRTFCVIDLRGDLIDRILMRLTTVAPEKLENRLLVMDLRDEKYAV